MGIFDWFKKDSKADQAPRPREARPTTRRPIESSSRPKSGPTPSQPQQAPTNTKPEAVRRAEQPGHQPLAKEDRWYVPADGDMSRFMPEPGGMPPLHLIPYTQDGETVLRLCEDSTGLLVGPTDRRLQRAGIYVSNLQGEQHYKTACRAGDFSPGVDVELIREPENKYDPRAIAVAGKGTRKRAAYINKGKARSLAKVIDAGTELRAISLRGTPSGSPCEQIAVLAAAPELVEHLLSERPPELPRPAHLR